MFLNSYLSTHDNQPPVETLQLETEFHHLIRATKVAMKLGLSGCELACRLVQRACYSFDTGLPAGSISVEVLDDNGNLHSLTPDEVGIYFNHQSQQYFIFRALQHN